MNTQDGLHLFDHYTRVIRIAMARDHAHREPVMRLVAETELLRYYLLRACTVAAIEDPTPTADDLAAIERDNATDWQITQDIEERKAA